MAAIAATRNSTIVRALTLLGLRVRFALGSWLAPTATLQRAYRLFGTPLPGTRRRALAARLDRKSVV